MLDHGYDELFQDPESGICATWAGSDRGVAGDIILPQDYDILREAGVQAIFGPGTNLVDAAGEVLKLLGHNMPPLEEAAE